MTFGRSAAILEKKKKQLLFYSIFSRQAGHRFGEHVERVVPLLIKFINVDDDELRKFCLQAFEAFVLKCPKEMAPHIGTLTNICMELLAYDPNYNYEVKVSDSEISFQKA